MNDFTNWYIVIWLGFLLVYFFVFIHESIKKSNEKKKFLAYKLKTDAFLKDNHPTEKNLSEYSYWKANVEPKYRLSEYYPPDWGKRKRYVAELYNFCCALCSKDDRLGHTHHINPLSEGGNNEIKNLVYLCRNCHEDQHLHLITRRQKREQEIEMRGISEEEYFKEKKEQYKEDQEIDKLFGYSNRRFNKMKSKAIRAEKKGEKIDWLEHS